MITIKLEVDGVLATLINVKQMGKLKTSEDEEHNNYVYRYAFNKVDPENPISGRGDVVHDISNTIEMLADTVLHHINEGLNQEK